LAGSRYRDVHSRIRTFLRVVGSGQRQSNKWGVGDDRLLWRNILIRDGYGFRGWSYVYWLHLGRNISKSVDLGARLDVPS
jgi:hypothetical protein